MGTAQAVQGTSLGDQAEALAFGHSTAETRKADKQKEEPNADAMRSVTQERVRYGAMHITQRSNRHDTETPT